GHNARKLIIPHNNNVIALAIFQVIWKPSIPQGDIRKLIKDIIAVVTEFLLEKTITPVTGKQLILSFCNYYFTTVNFPFKFGYIFICRSPINLLSKIDRFQISGLYSALPS